MARTPKPRFKQVESLTHDEARRRNIPTAEMQALYAREPAAAPLSISYPRSTPLAPGERRERNPDLDPQLVWRGKDEQDWSDLVVHAPPLYIQEKVHPQVIIEDLKRRSGRWSVVGGQSTNHQPPTTDHPFQADLFADFNGLPDSEARLEFYQHDQNWSNRMILGDSLQVMASLAEREGLRGQVQCIYLDPPYGIRFNSNWQVSTRSRDVKDGDMHHISREPEQIKAFRDTWKNEIHSYLTYLRDRVTVARDLLADSGSIFVQIGDENVHRVRALLDELLGSENFCSLITFRKTTGTGSGLLDNTADFILWFAKSKPVVKFHNLFEERVPNEEVNLRYVQLPDGYRRIMTREEFAGLIPLPSGARIYRPNPLTSARVAQGSDLRAYVFQGNRFTPGTGTFKTNKHGLDQLLKTDRLLSVGRSLTFLRFFDDFPVKPRNNVWDDTRTGGFGDDRLYVVQTVAKLVSRCLLMTTDPGDLILDPTCGSGTTAYVAEQWGRRWITIDTSRVALALARARIMGARYPYYLLADSEGGRRKEGEITGKVPGDGPTHGDIRQGFVYERVPHITLKSIANNAEIDVIWEKWEAVLGPLRLRLSEASGQWSVVGGQKAAIEEWEVPRSRPADWPPVTDSLITEFWEARTLRQKEIDGSIARAADVELLYDKPYADSNKVRVAGPFTVESLSPHRVIPSDEYEAGEEVEAAEGARRRRTKLPYERAGETDFSQVVLEHLRTAGVQQAHKEDRISFTSLSPWPGEYVGAEGGVMEGASEKRAAILIGPEFGTISRPDLIAAAREAAEAGFDVLIACGFAYDAHASEFSRLGALPVLRARMNPDLHMADELKNTGAGNLFVVFGEPDVEVVGGQWLVTSGGRMVVAHERLAELSGLGSLEAINRLGGSDLSRLKRLALRREVRADQSDKAGGGLGALEHRGGGGPPWDEGVSPVSGHRQGLAGGGRDAADARRAAGLSAGGGGGDPAGVGGGDRAHARGADEGAEREGVKESGQWSVAGGRWGPDEIATIEALRPADFPLQLTTDHYAQVTIHGVDVFDPQTGEVRSGGTDDIAAWFIDTDYNEESFFVRHAYFLGAHDPYKALKTTLKAEIDEEAWATLYRATSRPFAKPSTGRFAVKVINHVGDEVMKVFQV